jgi:hypothetical protein
MTPIACNEEAIASGPRQPHGRRRALPHGKNAQRRSRRRGCITAREKRSILTVS